MPKILLVEDDPAIIKLYKRAFEIEHFDVDTADNGLSALELLPVSKPDIILLDIMMPTMNGLDFLRHITAGVEEGKTPVIVLTNVADPVVKEDAVKAGASFVIVKSQTEPDAVVKSINAVLNKEMLQEESLEEADTNQGSQEA